MIQLIINDTKVDLNENTAPVFTYDMVSPNSPSAFTTVHSKLIRLPLTTTNLNLFNLPHITFNVPSASYQLFVNSNLFDQGVVIVDSVSDSININLHSSLIQIAEDFSSDKYPDLWALWQSVSPVHLWELPAWSTRPVPHELNGAPILANRAIPEPYAQPLDDWNYFDDELALRWPGYDIFASLTQIGIPKMDSVTFEADKYLDAYGTLVDSVERTWFQTRVKSMGDILAKAFREFQLQKIMTLRGFFSRMSAATGITISNNVKNLLNGKFLTLPDLPYKMIDSRVITGTNKIVASASIPNAIYTAWAGPMRIVTHSEQPYSSGINLNYDIKSYVLKFTLRDGGVELGSSEITIPVGDVLSGKHVEWPFAYTDFIGDMQEIEVEVVRTVINRYLSYDDQPGVHGNDWTFSAPGFNQASPSGYEVIDYPLSLTMANADGDGYIAEQSFTVQDVYETIIDPWNLFLDYTKVLNLRFRPLADNQWILVTASEYYTSFFNLSDYVDVSTFSYSPYTFPVHDLNFTFPMFDTYSVSKAPDLWSDREVTSYPTSSSQEWFQFSKLKFSSTTKATALEDPESPGKFMTCPAMLESCDESSHQMPIPFTICTLSLAHDEFNLVDLERVTPYCYISNDFIYLHEDLFTRCQLTYITSYSYSPYTHGLSGYETVLRSSSPKVRSYPLNRTPEPPGPNYSSVPDYRDIVELINSSKLTIKILLTKFLDDNHITLQDFLSSVFWYNNRHWAVLSFNSFQPGTLEPVEITFWSVSDLSIFTVL